MQMLLPVLYAAVFFFLIYKMKFFEIQELSKNKLTGLFAIKLIAGFAVWAIYTFHYSMSDFHTFFSDSKILFDNFWGINTSIPMQNWDIRFDSVLFNTSRSMIFLNALIQLFSFGNLYVHILFFCFFSFLGLTALFKAFIKHFPKKKMALIVAIYFIPSVLFWSSAVLKDSLVISLAGLLIYFSDFGLKVKYTLSEKIIVVVLLVLIAFVKSYVAIVLLPVLLANYLIRKTSLNYFFLKYVTVFGFFALILFAIKILNSDYNVLQLIADKQAKAISEARGGVFLVNDKNFICVDYYKKETFLIPQQDNSFKIKAGSSYLSWEVDNMQDTTYISNSIDTATYKIYYAIPPTNTVLTLKRIKPDLPDFLISAPGAVINVLFQPGLFNIKSWIHLAAAIENLWILFVLILAILFFDKKVLAQKEILIFCLLFALILFVLIGITTPAVGAIVRYRTIGLLFFVPVILLVIDENKLKNKLWKK